MEYVRSRVTANIHVLLKHKKIHACTRNRLCKCRKRVKAEKEAAGAAEAARVVEVSEHVIESKMGKDKWTFTREVRAGESECALDIVIKETRGRDVKQHAYTKTDLKLVHCAQTKTRELITWTVYLFLERSGREIERYDMAMSKENFDKFDLFLLAPTMFFPISIILV